MARPASVSDLEIFRAVQQLRPPTASGTDTPPLPTPYQIRKLFQRTRGIAPSYGLIQGALGRLATLTAAGDVPELSAIEAADGNGVADSLTEYVVGLLRPVVLQLLTKAQQDAEAGEKELATQLQDATVELQVTHQLLQTAISERDSVRQQLVIAGNEQLAVQQQLAQTTSEQQAARATIEHQANEISHLKNLHQQERHSLEQLRRETQQTLAGAKEEIANLTINYSNALKEQAKEANLVVEELQKNITALTGRAAQLDEQRATAERDRQTLQQQLANSDSALRSMTSERDQLAAQLAGLREAAAQHRDTMEKALQTRDAQLETLRQELVEKRVAAERAQARAEGLLGNIDELKTRLVALQATAGERPTP